MAIPVIQSSNTATSTASDTLTITKPTGLAVGDLMIAIIHSSASGTVRTHNTPSGWTVIQKDGASVAHRPAAYYKIADSGDTAASNFSFTLSASTTAMSGVLARVTGHVAASPVTLSELDNTASPTGTVRTYTAALTPVSSNSLVVFSIGNYTSSMTGSPATVGTYTIAPSVTLTELADVGVKDGADDGHALGVAYGDYTGTTQITSRGATLSEAMTQDSGSIIFLINGSYDHAGTNALLSVSPTIFTNAGASAGTVGTNTLLSVSPDIFSQSGYANSPTTWTNPDKPSTTWTNPNK